MSYFSMQQRSKRNIRKRIGYPNMLYGQQALKRIGQSIDINEPLKKRRRVESSQQTMRNGAVYIPWNNPITPRQIRENEVAKIIVTK